MQNQEINIKNWVYNYRFDDLVKTKNKKIETKNILIVKRSYLDITNLTT